MKHKSKNLLIAGGFILVLGILGVVFFGERLNLKKLSSEMLVLREIESSILPQNPARRSELDKGCKTVSAVTSGHSDGVTCTRQIVSVYNGAGAYDSVKQQLVSRGWSAADKNQDFNLHYSNTINGLAVCMYLTQARIDFDTDAVNSEITIATMKDDVCWSFFNNEHQPSN